MIGAILTAYAGSMCTWSLFTGTPPTKLGHSPSTQNYCTELMYHAPRSAATSASACE